MEQQYKNNLLQSLQKGDSVEALVNLCQEAVLNEVKGFCSQREEMEAVEGLCRKLNFTIRTREILAPVKQDKHTLPVDGLMSYALAAGSYFLVYKLLGSHILSGLTAVAMGVAASLYKEKNKKVETLPVPEKQVVSTVEELEKEIDNKVALFKVLLSKPQPIPPLDKAYFGALKFLFDSYATQLAIVEENRDVFQQKRIEKMLKQYGYELIMFDEKHANIFEFSSADVPCITTTEPALIHVETQKCIFKGHVVMPFNQ